MKHSSFLLGACALLLAGCATMGGGSGLPKQRPADLVIHYSNGGGMQDQGENYYISQDSCVRDSRFEGHQNRWVCKPDAKQLDALYAQLVKDDVATIKTEDKGEVYDRGGITLHFGYGGKSFEIVDAGSSFVVERDADRFRRTADGIVGLVGECIQSQAIAIAFDLRVETGDSAVQECRISLDNTIILNWRAQNAEPLAKLRTLTLLPGRYELTASYQVGQKWFSIDWPLQFNTEKTGFQLILKNDSFTVIQK